MDYSSNPNWTYTGDINAYHGGTWIKHCRNYCEAVAIEDLDSAIGFTGAVMIERKTVSLPRKLSEAKKRISQALTVFGWQIADIAKFTPRCRRAATWEALLCYGFGDSDLVETLQLEPDGPMCSRDGWKADRKQTKGDIGGYVMAKYLD